MRYFAPFLVTALIVWLFAWSDRARTWVWVSIVLMLVCYAGFVALALKNVR